MYLSNIKLWNFRKFGSNDPFDLEKPHLSLNLTKGLNVLIGENDSGKTAIIDAIKLVLKTHSFEWIRVLDEDFYTDANRFRIELVFSDLADLEAKNFTEWLGWEGEGEHAIPYLKLMYDVKRKDSRIFPSDVLAGVDDEGYQLTAEAREFLKVTYLKPLRDALSELIPKKNSRLSQIFQGHEAFKGKDSAHHLLSIFRHFNASVEKYFEGKKFNANGDEEDLTEDINGKALKSEIDNYIQSFYDETKETDIKIIEGTLKSILEKLELSIKGDINLGLGTLNRLFMASELLHLNKKDWSGLRLGLIEELEAHLHPQAQMQVVEALQSQKDIQLILTTHSPNLASKVKLENLIICTDRNAFPLGVGYTKLDSDDYVFLERFLDVTKANLFFAKGIILVEGWSEDILLPSLAKQLKRQGIISKNLTEAGVSIINVGNLAFMRYSKIFLRANPEEQYSLPVSIITDVDITAYEKQPSLNEEGEVVKNGNGKVVYEYIQRNTVLVEQETSGRMSSLNEQFDHQKVKSFIAPNWTFEYSLYKSSSLGSIFKAVTLLTHPQIDQTQFESELAEKLLNPGRLDKTDIAYRIALEIEKDLQRSNEEKQIEINIEDESILYLINAIKYACGN